MTTLETFINDEFDPRMINKYLSKGRQQRSLAIWKMLHEVRGQLSRHGLAFIKALVVIALLVTLLYFAQ